MELRPAESGAVVVTDSVLASSEESGRPAALSEIVLPRFVTE
jgi:hypothetical protein